MAAILCRADQLPGPQEVRVPVEAHLAAHPPQEVAARPLQSGSTGTDLQAAMAASADRPSMAGLAIRRHYRRQEPDALTRPSGSVRGEPSNRLPCRDTCTGSWSVCWNWCGSGTHGSGSIGAVRSRSAPRWRGPWSPRPCETCPRRGPWSSGRGVTRRCAKCGWECRGGLLGEATFSRAFAACAASDVPGPLY